MGGTLTFAIRHEDGEVEQWSEWTNQIDRLVNTVAMVNDPVGHVRAWLDECAENDEFARGEEHAMMGKMEGGVRPHYYGLLVIDFMTQRILASQHYTSIGTRAVINIIVDWPQETWSTRLDWSLPREELKEQWAAKLKEDIENPNRFNHPEWRGGDARAPARLRGIIEAHKLSGIRIYDYEQECHVIRSNEEVWGTPHPTVDQVFTWLYENTVKYEWVLKPQPKLGLDGEPDLDENGDLVVVNVPEQKTVGDRACRTAEFLYDLSPWRISSFSPSREGYKAFRELLTQLDIELDEAKWDAYIEGFEPEED